MISITIISYDHYLYPSPPEFCTIFIDAVVIHVHHLVEEIDKLGAATLGRQNLRHLGIGKEKGRIDEGDIVRSKPLRGSST